MSAGKHSFAEVLKAAERPLIIVGAGALARPDGAAVAALAAKAAIELGAVKEGWNGYCVLHTAASRVGALEIGFVPGEGALNAAAMAKAGALDVLFLLGADEIDVPPGAFVVYIGTHGDNGAHRADVILPGAAYPEKSGLYVNTEGRVQMAQPRELPAGRCARGLVDPARAVRSCSARKLPYDSLAALRAGAVQGASAAGPHRPDRAERPGRYPPAFGDDGQCRQGAVPLGDRGLSISPTQSRARPR